MSNKKGFAIPLVIAIVGILAIAGGVYLISKNDKKISENNQALENTRKIAQYYINSYRQPECWKISEVIDQDFITYRSTRQFNDGCPGDPTSFPAKPPFKVNIKSGQILTMNLGGEFGELSSKGAKISYQQQLIDVEKKIDSYKIGDKVGSFTLAKIDKKYGESAGTKPFIGYSATLNGKLSITGMIDINEWFGTCMKVDASDQAKLPLIETTLRGKVTYLCLLDKNNQTPWKVKTGDRVRVQISDITIGFLEAEREDRATVDSIQIIK